ncbi:hypothetical protein ACIPPJ_33300 [Streptomyces sp. NPDC086091]|uniref:hypothetical protein n=1 Tax=Streptomyces sp. NPDC086091 TaxID=3365751 RepID=UPI0037F59FDB
MISTGATFLNGSRIVDDETGSASEKVLDTVHEAARTAGHSMRCLVENRQEGFGALLEVFPDGSSTLLQSKALPRAAGDRASDAGTETGTETETETETSTSPNAAPPPIGGAVPASPPDVGTAPDAGPPAVPAAAADTPVRPDTPTRWDPAVRPHPPGQDDRPARTGATEAMAGTSSPPPGVRLAKPGDPPRSVPPRGKTTSPPMERTALRAAPESPRPSAATDTAAGAVTGTTGPGPDAPARADGTAFAGLRVVPVPPSFTESIRRINEAVATGELRGALAMADRLRGDAEEAHGKDHDHVLEVLGVQAYAHHLLGEHVESLTVLLSLSEAHLRRRKPEAAQEDLVRAVLAWNKLRDPEHTTGFALRLAAAFAQFG